MAVVKLFYGSTNGNTQSAAHLIKAALGDLLSDVNNIADASTRDLQDADVLILGVSTWERGALQRDWAHFLPQMDGLDLRGKKVALFGLGDAKAFSGLFVNALRILHDTARERGAEIIGAWPADGYDFAYSAALEGDHFVGLVIDEENQSDLTVDRVGRWAALLRPYLTGRAANDEVIG